MSEFNRVNLNSDGSEVGKPVVNEYYGEDDAGSRDGGFRNRDAMASAVGDERYRNDPAYRSAVQRLVGQTSEEVLVGKPKPYDGSAVENMQLETDWLTTAMADPRYATSAVYRRQVTEHIARSQSSVRVQRGNDQGCHRVTMDSSASVDPMGQK